MKIIKYILISFFTLITIIINPTLVLAENYTINVEKIEYRSKSVILDVKLKKFSTATNLDAKDSDYIILYTTIKDSTDKIISDKYNSTQIKNISEPIKIEIADLVSGQKYFVSIIAKTRILSSALNETEVGRFTTPYSFIFTPGEDPVGIEPQKDSNMSKTKYSLLAPILGIKCLDTNSSDGCISGGIGEYLNLIFKILIGLCAALAVIMLIINGVVYMGDESVFGKTEAKHKMFSAIIGLIIVLASYAILNTINPDLTGKGGLNIRDIKIEVEEEFEPWSKYQTSGGKTVAGCESGFTDVETGANPNKIHVCKTIATNLKNMIQAARKDGIILSGSGYRDRSEQLRLRAENCQPPSKTQKELEFDQIDCKIATAIPGNSNHEKGLAVDFNCNGKSMKPDKTNKNNVCYRWLAENASKYNFYNNFDQIQETWHWSINGN